MINRIQLLNFKNISDFSTELSTINVLIGTNNSGKSSVLQGIHFSIMAEVIRRKLQKSNVPEDLLLYLPSSNFLCLRHNQQYTVSSGLTSKLTVENEIGEAFSIEISKGRNDRNVSICADNNSKFRQQVTAFNNLYSMYVPGISGVPINEKYISKAELRSAVARGDANMYIRNIIYNIKEDGKLKELNDRLHKFFPNADIAVPYNPDEDLFVRVTMRIKTDENNFYYVPIEQCGTGMLQVLQIIAYVLYFTPQLLLLDEPDEHLHPDNQNVLAEVLKDMAINQNMQIILCTHSRHLLSSLNEDATIIWMKEGRIFERDATDKYQILLDLGALDLFDKCVAGKYEHILLTEDANTDMIKKLFEYNDLKDVLVFPFKGCGNVDIALLLARFIHQQVPNCNIILHRDRDFMLDNEVAFIEKKIEDDNVIPFITDYSDIEAYFMSEQHISNILGVEIEEVNEWINELIQQNIITISMNYSNKRNEFKTLSIYTRKNNPEIWIPAIKLFPEKDLVDFRYVKGKFLKKKVLGNMYSKWGKNVNLFQFSDALIIQSLKNIKAKLL